MDQTFPIIGQTFQGLEPELAAEIKEIGGVKVREQKRAVRFEGDLGLLYKCLILSRTAIDFLVPIARGKVKNQDELYDLARTIKWDAWFKVTKTFSIQTIGTTDELNNTMFTSLKVKDALVDHFREIDERRPTVDKRMSKIRIIVRVREDEVTILMSSAGEPLFKRGYRKQTGDAPMNEVMAAALLMKAGYDGSQTLLDPMCGSGTIPIEAALMSSNTPPAYMRRHFACHHWKNFQYELWTSIFHSAMEQRKAIKRPILGSDVMRKAVNIARQNAENAELGEMVRFAMTSFEERPAPSQEVLIVTNPPYGERLGKNKIERIYTTLRDTLKTNYQGAHAWIISSAIEGLQMMGMKPSVTYQLKNGALDVEYCHYEVRLLPEPGDGPKPTKPNRRPAHKHANNKQQGNRKPGDKRRSPDQPKGRKKFKSNASRPAGGSRPRGKGPQKSDTKKGGFQKK